MSDVLIKPGMRVRIRLGMLQHISPGVDPEKEAAKYGATAKGRHNFVQWVAGCIPVGATGTVYRPETKRPSIYNPLAIRWDNYPTPEGKEFGTGLEEGQPLSYWLEEISDESGHDIVATVENATTV